MYPWSLSIRRTSATVCFVIRASYRQLQMSDADTSTHLELWHPTATRIFVRRKTTHVIGSLGPFGRLRQYKRRGAVMTTDQFDQALGQSTLTDKVLSLRLPKRSNENQRSTLRPNEIHCSIITMSLSVHGHFTKNPFVGNPSFNYQYG